MGAPSGPLLSSARRSAVRVNGAPSAAGATMVMVSRVALVLRVRPDRHRKFAGDFHVVDGRARTESSERREACRCVSVCASARLRVLLAVVPTVICVWAAAASHRATYARHFSTWLMLLLLLVDGVNS